MKKLILTSALALLFSSGGALWAQNYSEEYLGLPGDNLNLFAVMNLFQDSETLEAFERSINDPEKMINNLDLNGDNLVDYILVFDYAEGNVHNIVLRVALSRNEFQDVAVFTVEKLRNGQVQVQLIGDEALYGPNYIIEPNYAERANPGYHGNVVQQRSNAPRPVTVVHTSYYDVAAWPVIVYLSRPAYRPWRSAWYWGYYPTYWQPWTPYYWHYYHGYHYNYSTYYYTYYRPWHRPRCVRYQTVYVTRIRNYSPTVVVNVNQGVYKNTYSRPDTRSQGEVRYAQRQAVGGTVSERRPASGSNEAINRSRTVTESNTPVSRSAAPANNPQVTNPRNRATNPPEKAAAPVSRERATQAPASRPAVNAPRQAPQSSNAQTAPSRERASAPAPAVQRPNTNTKSNRSATRTAPATQPRQPASSARQAERSNNRSAGTSVQKSAPQRQSSSPSRSAGSSSSSSSRSRGK